MNEFEYKVWCHDVEAPPGRRPARWECIALCVGVPVANALREALTLHAIEKNAHGLQYIVTRADVTRIEEINGDAALLQPIRDGGTDA
jgi:hypothetical protein